MKTFSTNEIVQLIPGKCGNKCFDGCLLVVTLVHDWGVEGFVQTVGQNGQPGGQVHYRAPNGTFEKTYGRVAYAPVYHSRIQEAK